MLCCRLRVLNSPPRNAGKGIRARRGGGCKFFDGIYTGLERAGTPARPTQARPLTDSVWYRDVGCDHLTVLSGWPGRVRHWCRWCAVRLAISERLNGVASKMVSALFRFKYEYLGKPQSLPPKPLVAQVFVDDRRLKGLERLRFLQRLP